MPQAELVGILTMLLPLVVTPFLAWWFSRRRQAADVEQVHAEAVKTTTETAVGLLTPLRAELSTVRGELLEAEARIKTLEDQHEACARIGREQATEIAHLHGQVSVLTMALDTVTRERDELRARVSALEAELAAMRKG